MGAAARPTAYPVGAVRLLAGGQTAIWAAIFYSFAALLPYWETALGWSKESLSLGLTLALAASALAAPRVGALIDAGFGRALLAGGALLGGLLMAALARVETLNGFLLIWAGLGLAHAACLYEPCFAVLVRRLGPAAPRAITQVALLAGLASTLAFPLGGLVAEAAGWRAAALVFALLAAFAAAPALWLGAGGLPAGTAPPAGPGADRAAARAAMRRPAFAALAVAAAALSLGHGMIMTHLLALLAERGAPTAAALAVAAAVGPMQVAGRLVLAATGERVAAVTVARLAFAALAVAAATLLFAGANAAPLFAFAALQGAGAGVMSVLRPALAAEALGREGFGRISGALATAFLGGFAAAPLAGALFWRLGGYDAMLLAAGALALAGLAALGFVRAR